MSLAVSQSAASAIAGTATSRTISLSSSVTGGNSVVVQISSRFPVSVVQDSKGNLYTQDVAKNQSGTCVSTWRSSNVSGGASFVVTATQTLLGPMMACAQEISANLVLHTILSANGVSFTPSPGSINTTVDSTYAAIAFNAGVSGGLITAPFNWNSRVSDNFSQLGACADQIFSSKQSALSAAWTLSGMASGRSWASCAAIYAEAVTAPGISAVMPPDYLQSGLLLPDAFWFLPSLTPPPVSPPPPAAASVRQPETLVPVISDALQQAARKERQSRILALFLNDMARMGALYRTASGYAIRGRGFSGARAPTVTDDATKGVGPASFWVDTTDTTSPRIYCCADPTAGAAQWFELPVATVVKPQGGATGVF